MINEIASSKLIYLVDFYYNYDDVVSFYVVINDNDDDDMKNIRREIINKIECK